jgi:fumarate reductase subunit C
VSGAAALAPNAEARSRGIDQARRWYWQRISAMVLTLCVVVHLVVIIYAVRGGLSAAEILARTRGHWGWAAFYSIFVVAAAVHVPIGLAAIVREWGGLGERSAVWMARAIAVALLLLGLRSVCGVVLP